MRQSQLRQPFGHRHSSADFGSGNFQQLNSFAATISLLCATPQARMNVPTNCLQNSQCLV